MIFRVNCLLADNSHEILSVVSLKSKIMMHRSRAGGGGWGPGGWGPGVLTPLENHKAIIGFLSRIPYKIIKLPNQHSMLEFRW